MITAEEPAQTSVFNEDIVLAGETIIGYPCVVYSITITNDGAAGILNISDSTTYNSTYKATKVAVGAAATVEITYPKGRRFTRGLSAAANAGSIDIDVTFD